MNKSLVAAFAALSAPVISLTTEHRWDRYDQPVHVPVYYPSLALQDKDCPDGDSTQPHTDGGNGSGTGQTVDPEDYSNYVDPADCCRKHDGDLTALLAEIEAVEAEIRM